MHKKITADEYEELKGPMNAVSKDDAMHYAGVEGKAEEDLDPDEARAVRAKKQKLVTSTKKHDRHLNKQVANHLCDSDKYNN